MVAYAWAGFGAAFGPVVILSVLWKRITAYGALSGMIAGALTVVVWAEWIKKPALAAQETGFATVYEIVPGFIICTLVIVLVSLIDKNLHANCKNALKKQTQNTAPLNKVFSDGLHDSVQAFLRHKLSQNNLILIRKNSNLCGCILYPHHNLLRYYYPSEYLF